MKKIITCVVVVMLLGCFSCQRKREQVYLPVDAWDGQNFSLISDGYPVSIVWFTGWQERPYKGFCQAGEIKEIIERLLNPEIAGTIPELPLKLGTRNMLCLFYYKGGKYVSRVAVVDFDIDEDGFFLGPRGKSPSLAKLLLEKEESGLARYAYNIYPYDEAEFEKNIAKRMEWEARYEREQEQKRKELEALPFELVDTTLDVFSDPEFDFRGILIQHCEVSDPNHAVMLLGELHVAQWIVGHDINADKIHRYPQPMFHVFEEFKKADRVKQHAVNMYDVLFLNRNNRKGYRIKMAVNSDKKYVYGEGYRSKQLYKDFAELGLFEK